MSYFSAGRLEKGRDVLRLGTLELKASRLESDTRRENLSRTRDARKERGKIFLFCKIAVNGKSIGTQHGTVETSSKQPDQRAS